MSYDLQKPTFTTTDLAIAHTQQQIERFSGKDIRRLQGEAAAHLAAEHAQAIKAVEAERLIRQVYNTAHQQSMGFAQEAQDRLLAISGNGITPHSTYEQITQELTSDCQAALRATAEIASRNIAFEVSKPVIIPKEKSWWER